MESKTNLPNFTVSLRGYDRMEVDEYLDSLAEALGRVDNSEDRVHGMQAHIDRLNARIAELEERIRGDVPKTGAVLGERIAIMLRSAEETAADTVQRAEARAAELLDKAETEVASAEDRARGAIARGEEQARRIETAARAQGSEIVAEAEARAAARTRQIEQWAEQVISHTRAEEARLLGELQQKREEGEAEIEALFARRDEIAANIAGLRDALQDALGLVGNVKRPEPAPMALPAASDEPEEDALDEAPALAAGSDSDFDSDSALAGEEDEQAHESPLEAAAREALAQLSAGPQASPGTDLQDDQDLEDEADEMPWPTAFHPNGRTEEDSTSDHTGRIEAADAAEEAGEADDFDTKFDAWVSEPTGEPRHFRRL